MDALTKVIEKFEEDMTKRGFKIQKFYPEKDGKSVDVMSPILGKVCSTIRFTQSYGAEEGIYVEAPGELKRGVISLRAMGEGLRLIHETDYWLNANGTFIEGGLGECPITESGIQEHNNIWRKYRIDEIK